MSNSKKTFRFQDSRQENIHRRLLLIGPGPASFYRDACSLMNESQLESTSHVVAHLLREVDRAVGKGREPIGAVEDKTKPHRLNEKARRGALALPRKLEN